MTSKLITLMVSVVFVLAASSGTANADPPISLYSFCMDASDPITRGTERMMCDEAAENLGVPGGHGHLEPCHGNAHGVKCGLCSKLKKHELFSCKAHPPHLLKKNPPGDECKDKICEKG